MFSDFTFVDFQPSSNVLPSISGVYVFCLIMDGVHVPFYVGQTMRLSGRMDDYCAANFAACTDFRVGEAVRYLRDAKKFHLQLGYRPSAEPRRDERAMIRELQLTGVWLLNYLVAYDYRNATADEERTVVHRY